MVVSDGPNADPTFELGTGQLGWETLPPFGGRAELIHGPQGGYHIFGRVRYTGLSPDVRVWFRVTPVEGGAPLNDPTDRIRLYYDVNTMTSRGLLRTAAGWESSNALLVILVNIQGPAGVVGRRFRFEAFAQAAGSDAIATTEREITIVDKT